MYKKIKKFLLQKFFHYPKFWDSRSIISYFLLALSPGAKFFSFSRKKFTKKIFSPKIPIICIGNATVGGTGKTPIIIALAKELLKKNKKIAIITKGYGSILKEKYYIVSDSLKIDNEFCPDEALEIHEMLKKAAKPLIDYIVIISKNLRDVEEIFNELDIDIILVDDGLQNPTFRKDYSILCIDSIRGFGNGFLLPAGPLRETYSSTIKKIDSVIISQNAKIAWHKSIDEFIKILPQNIKIYQANTEIALEIDMKKRYFAFSAIADPSKFYNFLRCKYFNIVGTKSYPDHYIFSRFDIKLLCLEAEKSQAEALITTYKDYVKCGKELYKMDLVPLEIVKKIDNIDEIIDSINNINIKNIN